MAMEARSKAQQPQAREFTDQDVEQKHGLVGGSENYNNMMSWANQNVSEQEVNMYDAVMELGNPLALEIGKSTFDKSETIISPVKLRDNKDIIVI